jgi:hypothetical protein
MLRTSFKIERKSDHSKYWQILETRVDDELNVEVVMDIVSKPLEYDDAYATCERWKKREREREESEAEVMISKR